MANKAYVLLGCLLLSLQALAQDYFQQRVDYRIEVTLDDEQHRLRGTIALDYTNNSPQTLSEILFHLWPNGYKDHTTALAKQLLEGGETNLYFAEEKDRGWIDSLAFAVNGQAVSHALNSENPDMCKVELPTPLQPGQTITISTPFTVKIPLGIYSRLGHIGQAYQITQWYPKPAVYDQEGWHHFPYLNQGEFYSEYGSFDVKITVPSNYVVGATGDLQNEEELAWLNAKAERTKNISKFNASDMAFPASSDSLKTLHFKQDRVHDFAWFADKRFHVLKGEVELPHSKRKVTSWALFTNRYARLWKNSLKYLNQSTYYYSLWNGDYPYNHVSAVDGALVAGGGMEYPNITVIGDVTSALSLETVIAHEVGHNWFYGILGSDERRYPFLDEGINSYYEDRYLMQVHPNLSVLGTNSQSAINRWFDLTDYPHREQAQSLHQFSARANRDQPVLNPSEVFTEINYGAMVYSKGGLSMRYLAAYMGQDSFDQAMQEYFETWKFKHPSVQDLRVILEKHAGKSLGWFFEGVVGSSTPLDYKVGKARVKGNVVEVTVRNKGKVNGPIVLNGISDSDTSQSFWFEGFEGKQKLSIPNQNYSKVRLDAHTDLPEFRRKNNTSRTKGLLRRVEPLRVQFLGSIENPDKTQLFYAPVVGYNTLDGWMPGIALYNHLALERKIEYTLVPMYSGTADQLRGLGRIDYNLFPEGVSPFRKVSIGVSGQQFGRTNRLSQGRNLYWRLAPQLNFALRKPWPRSPIDQHVRLRSVILSERFFDPERTPRSEAETYLDARYSFANNRTLNPYQFQFTATTGRFTRLEAEGKYRLSLRKGNGLNLRFYGGWTVNDDFVNVGEVFRMDGISGPNDYKADHLLFDREDTTSFWGYQLTPTQGGFKVPTSVGLSASWLTAVNIKFQIPIGLPIGVFADVGLSGQLDGELVYDSGVYIPLVHDVVEVYFPVFLSQSIRDQHDANGLQYGQTIRFLFQLESMNPLNLTNLIF